MCDLGAIVALDCHKVTGYSKHLRSRKFCRHRAFVPDNDPAGQISILYPYRKGSLLCAI